MSQPEPGQPYNDPGMRISIGDPDPAVTPGTDAYRGVIVLEGGVPTPYIVDAAAIFQIRAYFKTILEDVPYHLEPTFSVEFHLHDLNGTPAPGSPFTAGITEGDTPAGFAPAIPPEEVTWYSSTVDIPANTLTSDTTYRITVDGDDAAHNVFAFHDGAVLHTQA